MIATRIFYIRDENRNPVGCLTYLFGKNEIRYSYSCCNFSAKDRFIKKEGRKKALERLITDYSVLRTVSEHKGEMFFELLDNLATDKKVPSRLRKNIKRYLVSYNYQDSNDDLTHKQNFYLKYKRNYLFELFVLIYWVVLILIFDVIYTNIYATISLILFGITLMLITSHLMKYSK